MVALGPVRYTPRRMPAVRPTVAAPAPAAVSLPDIPTRTVTVDGCRVHYADLAPGGVEVGPPVLWIHGLGGWLRNWAANLDAATALGYRCVALDLPGFGESDKPNVAYDLPYFRGALTACMDALDIPRATLVGNSMGGMIALAMAIRNPERVDRLVLVDAAGVHQVRRIAVAITLDMAGAVVRKGGNMRRVVRAMRRWVFEQHPPELLAELQLEFAKYAHEDRTMRRHRARSYMRALWHITRTNLRPWLPTISAPTLVVHGKQDKLVPFDTASILHREIPHATLAAFEGVGHVPQMEVPERFNARLTEFLLHTPAASATS